MALAIPSSQGTTAANLAALIHSQLSNWKDRAIEAYDENGKENFRTAEGELKPGIYRNLPNDVYHSLPALSSSGIKLFSDSPAKYERKYRSNVNRRKTEAKNNSLQTGTLVHALILEPDVFHANYCREPLPLDEDYDGVELLMTADDIKEKLRALGLKISGTKAELTERLLEADPSAPVWEHIKESILLGYGAKGTREIEGVVEQTYGGRKPIDGVMWDDAMRAALKCEQHAEASLMFQDGESEVAFIGLCKVTGMWLKCKFDWLRYDDRAVDLKTTRSANPSDFVRDALYKFRYDLQIAFYRYVASLLDVFISDFPLVAIEFAEADICQPFDLLEEDLKSAQDELIELLRYFHKCDQSGYFPGYFQKDVVAIMTKKRR